MSRLNLIACNKISTQNQTINGYVVSVLTIKLSGTTAESFHSPFDPFKSPYTPRQHIQYQCLCNWLRGTYSKWRAAINNI